ncbi:NUDIX domain-containing protein [Roseibacillus ishigakijimensis]|uniref:NUDIX domain-containing protein n=1 Tax=Roseibacillus ishigakijimensis TaxID=454146 RepID=A0A934RRS1_9BACT|nr:NUDIX domain-containing protein [Roseibacillus ishigakijimensis]MBK1834268.1 NUDIX domain-containing protein [Roseibacillus ishigakijimensis]
MEFRPNVALLLVREDGRLLICERIKVKGAWQFPQGGVDEGETLEEALKREVEEEIGLLPQSYDILEMRGGYRYLYPPSVKKRKRKGWFDGQEQTYYRCLLHDVEAKIDIQRKPREFRQYKWIKPADFKLTWLPEFKREVYRKVMWDFFEVKL